MNRERPQGQKLEMVFSISFFLVKPANYLIQRPRKEAPADPTVKKCPECLSEIPVDARRCAYCTAEVGAAAGMA